VWPGVRVLLSVTLRLACRLIGDPLLFAGVSALVMAVHTVLTRSYCETAWCVIDAWTCGTVVAGLGWLRDFVTDGMPARRHTVSYHS
jgi:hypothetical protein